MVTRPNAVALSFLAGLFAADIGHAQINQGQGYDPALTATSESVEQYQITLKLAETARPIINHNFRNYDHAQCEHVIGNAKLSNTDDGNVWHASARRCLIDEGALIAASHPATAIIVNNVTEDTQGNFEVAVHFLDSDGNFVKPNAVSVYDLDKKRMPFDFDDYSSTTTEVNYHFLVDRSGSMLPVKDDVQNSVRRFAARLPNSRDCLLHSFATDFVSHPGRDCRSIGSIMDTIKFGGTTNLYTALDALFSRIPKANPKSDRFDVVLVLSDGVPTDSRGMKAQLQQAKTAPLFVYWMGGYNRDALGDLVDYEAVANQGIGNVSMDTFLEEIGVSVEEQFVLRFKRPE